MVNGGAFFPEWGEEQGGPPPLRSRTMQATHINMSQVGMAPGHQHGLSWLARPRASAELSVATGAMDTILDLSLPRAMDPDLAPGGGTSHPDQHDPGGSMVLGR